MEKRLLGDYSPSYYDGSPWHFKSFMRSETESLPLDKDSAVLYHGGHISDFFIEKHTPKKNYQKKSILASRVLSIGNSSQQHDTVAMSNLDESLDFNVGDRAIYCGMMEVAKAFASQVTKDMRSVERWEEGLVYEIQFPTANLEMAFRDPEGVIGKPELQGGWNYASSSKELINKLGGDRQTAVSNLRKLIKSLVKKGGVETEAIQFGYTKPLEADRITRIWPLHYSKEPRLMDTGTFLEWLYSTEAIYQHQLPDRDSTVEQETGDIQVEAIEERFREVRKVEESMDRVSENLDPFYARIEQSMALIEQIFEERKNRRSRIKAFMKYSWYSKTRRKKIQRPEEELEERIYESWVSSPESESFKGLLNALESFNNHTENLLDMTGEYLDVNFNEIGTFVEAEFNKQQLKREVKGVRNAIRKIEKEEKMELETSDPEKIRKYQKHEERIIQAFEQILDEFPDFRPLEQNIKNMDFDEFIDYNLKEMEKLERK